MKKLTAFLIIPFLWIACTNDQKAGTQEETEKAIEPKETVSAESEKLLVLPWTAVYDPETQQLELKHNDASDAGNLTVQDMIDAINLKYPETKLYKTSQQNDTLSVTINDASFLTQQSGTTGAEAYLAEATFALTELQGIKAVNFHFQEGDHAVPKTYTRESFKGFN